MPFAGPDSVAFANGIVRGNPVNYLCRRHHSTGRRVAGAISLDHLKPSRFPSRSIGSDEGRPRNSRARSHWMQAFEGLFEKDPFRDMWTCRDRRAGPHWTPCRIATADGLVATGSLPAEVLNACVECLCDRRSALVTGRWAQGRQPSSALWPGSCRGPTRCWWSTRLAGCSPSRSVGERGGRRGASRRPLSRHATGRGAHFRRGPCAPCRRSASQPGSTRIYLFTALMSHKCSRKAILAFYSAIQERDSKTN